MHSESCQSFQRLVSMLILPALTAGDLDSIQAWENPETRTIPKMDSEPALPTPINILPIAPESQNLSKISLLLGQVEFI